MPSLHHKTMEGVEISSLDSLHDLSPSKRLAAASTVKHSIVGSPRSKKLYLSRGAPQLFTSLLMDPSTSPALSVECAAVLAAFGRMSHDVAQNIVAAGALRPLERMLQDSGEVRSSAARALGVLREWGGIKLADLENEDAVRGVIRLLESEEFAAIAFGFLVPACDDQDTLELLIRLGLCGVLINLLGRAKSRVTIATVLQLLATICEASVSASSCVVESGVVSLARKTIRVGNMLEKMAGVDLLSVLYSQGVIGIEAMDKLLVTVFDLLSENNHNLDDVGAKVLARLLRLNESFRPVAVDCCAGFDIVVLLERCVGDAKKNIIYAMAKLASDTEDLRVSMSGLVVMKHLLGALSADDEETVMTASLCIQHLTRSPKFLRDKREVKPMLNHVLDEILEKLLLISKSTNIEVQRSALRAVCNMVLAYPRKLQTASREHVWKSIVELTSSTDEEVRVYAVWALKNLFFEVKMEDLISVQRLFNYCNLVSLCRDPSVRVREQAMSVIRNLSCAMTDLRQSQSIEHLKIGLGDDLFRILEHALVSVETSDADIARQALRVVANIAASDERHKMMLLDGGVVKTVMTYLAHPDASLRIAAITVFINLASANKTRGSLRVQAHEASGHGTRRRVRFCGRESRSEVQDANGNDALTAYKYSDEWENDSHGPQDKTVITENLHREGRFVYVGQDPPLIPSPDHVEVIKRLTDLGIRQQLLGLQVDSHVEVRFRGNEALGILREANDA